MAKLALALVAVLALSSVAFAHRPQRNLLQKDGGGNSAFAASWASDPVVVGVTAGNQTLCRDSFSSGSGTASDPCYAAVAQLGRIAIAQQKDLLIGLSAEVGLYTMTKVKSNSQDPTLGSALAAGAVRAKIMLFNVETGAWFQTVAPGPITLSSRMQELKMNIDTTVEDLLETNFNITMALIQRTLAAHHFNFVGYDLIQGTYDVKAVFDLTAYAAVSSVDQVAEAEVVLASRMMTIQEVRAHKDSTVIYQDPTMM